MDFHLQRLELLAWGLQSGLCFQLLTDKTQRSQGFLFGVVSLTDFSASGLREPLLLFQLSGLCVCFVDYLQVVANRRAPGLGQVREALHC